MPTPAANLRLIIDAILDGRATADELRFLEQAAQADPSVVTQYVDAVNVHASMVWDHGNVDADIPAVTETTPAGRFAGFAGTGNGSRWTQSAVALAAIAIVAFVVASPWTATPDQPVVDNTNGLNPLDPRDVPAPTTPKAPATTVADAVADAEPVENISESPAKPTASVATTSTPPIVPRDSSATMASNAKPEPKVETPDVVPSAKPMPLVAFVDQSISERWRDEGIKPSPLAEPTTWLRRASLDLKGRIPTRGEIESFLTAPEKSRREDFVAAALASGEYADHFATVWSNLLVGRSSKRAANRERLHGYLVDAFGENRSWGDIAGELVAAEGTEQNPPTNFLLAHLNNEAVPATAITARVLLGRQIQCTQCHSHPFNDWKQDQFWELNAFFQQCEVEERTNDAGDVVRTLVDREAGGPTFFETRRGLMQVAYPIYAGERIDEDPTIKRRSELARLIVTGEKTDLAEAMVNRLWSHFMGTAFTREIDDLGPHAMISHPEVLDRLTKDFVASGYDIKQLVTWIMQSQPYQLSGQWSEANAIDRPEIGESPLFSRVYEKPLSPEQLYDSLVTAAAGPRAAIPGLPSRDEWVAEFYAAQDNEENGEMSTFEASPSVALELMNGKLISHLVTSPQASALTDVLTMRVSEDERLDAISMLVLGRESTPTEKKTLRKVLRPTIEAYSQELPRIAASREGFRDLFWAYVNSSEFTVNR